MTLREFCRESGLSKRTVRSYIRKGRIQPKRSGFRYDFSLTDIRRAYMGTATHSPIESDEILRPIESINAPKKQTVPPPTKAKNLTGEKQAMKNVRSQHALRHFKIGLVIAILLFIFLLFVWNNFRTVSITFSISEGYIVQSNMQPDHGSYYKLTHTGSEIPATMYVRSDLDIPLDTNREYHFSQAEITVRLPIRRALRDKLRISGTRLVDSEEIIQTCLIQSTEYMKYIYITDITG